MKIVYDAENDSIRIEFIETSEKAEMKDPEYVKLYLSNGKLAGLEIPNTSKKIPPDAFKEIYLNLPTRSPEAMEKYRQDSKKE